MKKYQKQNVMGCDETGVGDYLTPLVAASVFVPWQNVSKLIKIGVIDSKKLSDQKIVKLAAQIKPIVISEVKHLTQGGYNKLNQNLNANELKTFLHLTNINRLENKIHDIDLVIVDQFSNLKSFNKYIARLVKMNFNLKKIKNKNINLIVNGELEHVAVAAASILARDKFLHLMKIQNATWKTNFPLGTNNKVEAFARDFLNKHGQSELKKVAKWKFKTTKKILNLDVEI